ncbi:DUF1642 domain-containing protein [Enterococcus faecium]|nr:DUF1642 domain-containing protein [Enterococcus faecium]
MNKQIEEPQKSVVPQSIAVLIEKYKEDDVQLTDILVCFKDWSESEEADYRDEISWVVANPETFMRAWLIGYEVEKEPQYMVPLLTDKEGNKKILVERRESTTSFGIMRMRTTGMSC